MIIEKGTKLHVNSTRRGEFLAVARRSFSTEDKTYPLTVVDPMGSRCAMHEEVNPLAWQTNIEFMDQGPVEDVNAGVNLPEPPEPMLVYNVEDRNLPI